MPNPTIDRTREGLLPCPFCGETDFLTVSHTIAGDLQWWSVECGCNAFGGAEDSHDAAVTWWNTRAAPAAPVGWQDIETVSLTDRVVLWNADEATATVGCWDADYQGFCMDNGAIWHRSACPWWIPAPAEGGRDG